MNINKAAANPGWLFMPPNSQPANPTHGGTAVSQPSPATPPKKNRPPQPLPGRPVQEKNLTNLLHIETVEIHHFGPGSSKVFHKLGLTISAAVHFGNGAQLRVGTKNQVHP